MFTPLFKLSLLLSFVLFFFFLFRCGENRMCKNKCENNCLILYFALISVEIAECRNTLTSHLHATTYTTSAHAMQWMKSLFQAIIICLVHKFNSCFIYMWRKKVHWFISQACWVAYFHVFICIGKYFAGKIRWHEQWENLKNECFLFVLTAARRRRAMFI